eukprot:TRINITY_DN9240_c0_g1_i1.p1 TRINITY_DN9240_c0_g1~~TRINITY_DN9240_c0_g1_i1.p1  ORF type:complete len:426 (-),score=90.34 TRINITY_DN9240_c0_g1_i1:73-1350(-)
MGTSSCKECNYGLCHCCGPGELIPFRDSGGSVRMLIVALDYEYAPEAELTATRDALTMFRIAGRAGVEDITVVTDKQGVGAPSFPTRSYVLRHLRQVARRCQAGDWFVWFWAGHGVQVDDFNHEEASGKDQAFVTPDAAGRLTESAVLIDDEFALALDTFVPEGVRILCINDCCHSGTIADIDTFQYTHEIYSISASLDSEEAEDTGGGGVLSTALRRSVRQLSVQYGKREFSIQSVFDACSFYARRLTREQHLQLQWSGPAPSTMAWPLSYPWWLYLQKVGLLREDIDDFEEDGLDLESDSEWMSMAPQDFKDLEQEQGRLLPHRVELASLAAVSVACLPQVEEASTAGRHISEPELQVSRKHSVGRQHAEQIARQRPQQPLPAQQPVQAARLLQQRQLPPQPQPQGAQPCWPQRPYARVLGVS